MSDLRIAVLGLGMMGAFHVDLLSSSIKGATVTVVNDFVADKAEAVAARIGARVVADPIAAINDRRSTRCCWPPRGAPTSSRCRRAWTPASRCSARSR